MPILDGEGNPMWAGDNPDGSRLCVLCNGLVTPKHRMCGWHDWLYERTMRDFVTPALMQRAKELAAFGN